MLVFLKKDITRICKMVIEPTHNDEIKMDVGPALLFFFIIYFGYFTKYKENFTNTHDDRCLYIRVSILALVAE
jgi:hypothetical protein